jgi:hypothetical protein
MRKDLAIMLAQQDENIKNTKNTSELMKRVNEIASSDGSNEKVFPQVDIVFATFTDYIKETATQREKDLLIVSEFLTRVWQSLHVSDQGLGEKLNEVEKSDLILLKSSLDNLELTHLLTDGLSYKTLKMVNELTEKSSVLKKSKKKI